MRNEKHSKATERLQPKNRSCNARCSHTTSNLILIMASGNCKILNDSKPSTVGIYRQKVYFCAVHNEPAKSWLKTQRYNFIMLFN